MPGIDRLTIFVADPWEVHFAPWHRNQMKLELGASLRPIIEGQHALEVPVDWIPDAEAAKRYLNRPFGNSYDFSQAP